MFKVYLKQYVRGFNGHVEAEGARLQVIPEGSGIQPLEGSELILETDATSLEQAWFEVGLYDTYMIEYIERTLKLYPCTSWVSLPAGTWW